MHDGLLVDAGVLVGALELGQRVDVRADFTRKLAFMRGAFDADDDAFGIDRVDNPGALAEDHRAGIARGHHLHAGSDVRRVGAQQRNGLPLHVRTHQRAVGVVVFEKRNQAGGHRDKLFGTNVDVLDLIAMLQNEVPGLPCVRQIGHDVPGLDRGARWPGRSCTYLLPKRKGNRSGLQARPSA